MDASTVMSMSCTSSIAKVICTKSPVSGHHAQMSCHEIKSTLISLSVSNLMKEQCMGLNVDFNGLTLLEY